MIVTFFDRNSEDAHGEFQQWRARHYDDGYFLNYKSPNDVWLHRSPCPHLSGTDWARAEYGRSLTSSKKVCSTDRRKLKRWASKNASAGLQQCRDCKRL